MKPTEAGFDGARRISLNMHSMDDGGIFRLRKENDKIALRIFMRGFALTTSVIGISILIMSSFFNGKTEHSQKIVETVEHKFGVVVVGSNDEHTKEKRQRESNRNSTSVCD